MRVLGRDAWEPGQLSRKGYTDQADRLGSSSGDEHEDHISPALFAVYLRNVRTLENWAQRSVKPHA
jgi:hypothetical protein